MNDYFQITNMNNVVTTLQRELEYIKKRFISKADTFNICEAVEKGLITRDECKMLLKDFDPAAETKTQYESFQSGLTIPTPGEYDVFINYSPFDGSQINIRKLR